VAEKDLFYLAPLQGFTDYAYRKCFHQVVGGFTEYYIPYLSLGPGNKIRNSQLRDLLPGNNAGVPVVPQILCADAQEAFYLAKIVSDYGYTSLNLNMGCPYPMATNRGRGSALLENPDKLKSILDELFGKFNFQISIKFRAGMENDRSIFELIPVLKAYPFSRCIFHPRTADQLYKGEANRNLFAELRSESGLNLIYNGDIQTQSDIDKVRALAPGQKEWMIGRGLLSDPFLIQRINNNLPDAETMRAQKREFHQLILEEYQRQFSDDGQVLQKMKAFWSYFANSFSNPHKAFKPVKKASSLAKFKLAYPSIFNDFEV